MPSESRNPDLCELEREPVDAVLDRVSRDTAPEREIALRMPDLAEESDRDRVEESSPDSSVAVEQQVDALDQLRLRVRVELGRKRMTLEDALELSAGDVIDLQKSVEEPVDVFVGELLVARGEVVVIDGRIGVRITELVSSLPGSRVETRS